MALYPFTFTPIFKDKIWGGNKIKTVLHKDFAPLPNAGESWELSGVEGNISVVNNGPLQGKSLTDLIAEYKGDIVGKKIYDQFQEKFPLLIKFIDSNDDLSIQVHPDDTLGMQRHNSFGKTEMWYILSADQGANLISGFRKGIRKEDYLKALKDKKMTEILNFEPVTAGDCFYLPAGRVHAICKGILLAEIQQTSDITYRIYDWDRLDAQGKSRELHTELAVDAIDFAEYDSYRTEYEVKASDTTGKAELVDCKYFHTELVKISGEYRPDLSARNSFTIFICTEGEGSLKYADTDMKISFGDTVLIPACLDSVELNTPSVCNLLEVYIP